MKKWLKVTVFQKMTTKGDGEKCPSCDKKLAGEAMNEEEEEDDKEVGMNSIKNGYDKNPKVTKADFIPKKKDENLKEHRVQNHRGFYMDLNKLLK